MSLKLGLYRNKQKFCCSKFRNDAPLHSHSENNLENERLDKVLRPLFSQNRLERDRDFKRIYSATFETVREPTTKSHAYKNRFNLGQHLDVGQKNLYENQLQNFSKNQKLQQRRLGPFIVSKRIMITAPNTLSKTILKKKPCSNDLKNVCL